MTPFLLFQRIDQVITAQLLRREILERLSRAECLGQGSDQQCHGGQSLLAIDHEDRRLCRYLIQPLLDINDGANEVRRHTIVTASADDVIPQLSTLLFGPRIGSLIDRYYELRGFFEEGEQLGFGRFHTGLLAVRANAAHVRLAKFKKLSRE